MVLSVVLDTSFIISTMINSSSTSESIILKLLKSKTFLSYYSNETFQELQETLQKEYIKKILKNNLSKVAQFVAWYKYNSILSKPTKKFQVCRDLKDDKFLDLCFEVKANYLITNDKDLLVLKTFENTEIVTPLVFLSKIHKFGQ